jgi:hypothetical protein
VKTTNDESLFFTPFKNEEFELHAMKFNGQKSFAHAKLNQ